MCNILFVTPERGFFQRHPQVVNTFHDLRSIGLSYNQQYASQLPKDTIAFDLIVYAGVNSKAAAEGLYSTLERNNLAIKAAVLWSIAEICPVAQIEIGGLENLPSAMANVPNSPSAFFEALNGLRQLFVSQRREYLFPHPGI